MFAMLQPLLADPTSIRSSNAGGISNPSFESISAALHHAGSRIRTISVKVSRSVNTVVGLPLQLAATSRDAGKPCVEFPPNGLLLLTLDVGTHWLWSLVSCCHQSGIRFAVRNAVINSRRRRKRAEEEVDKHMIRACFLGGVPWHLLSRLCNPCCTGAASGTNSHRTKSGYVICCARECCATLCDRVSRCTSGARPDMRQANGAAARLAW